MSRTGSLYDLTDDELATIARKASVHAVRKIRAAGLTPAGIEPAVAVRGRRKNTGVLPVPTSQRRAKAVARGA